MNLRTLIIDDEKPARDLLRNYLTDYPFIEIAGEFENGFEALKAVSELNPQLLLLDIEMPVLNGFEMLELLEKRPFIIFTTAYNQYAIKAFELNAADYLLKPFSKERLSEAIARVRERSMLSKGDDLIPRLIEHFDKTRETLQRIVVKTGNKINLIYTEAIIYLEAQDDYVMIYTETGKYLKQATIKYYEDHLDEQLFVRVHRSFIVNISAIDRIELYGRESYILILKSGQKLSVSKSGYARLKKVLKF
ncbi:MAG: LytR/AlgR family response regulator transcription factor [Bacteroidales bacterium]